MRNAGEREVVGAMTGADAITPVRDRGGVRRAVVFVAVLIFSLLNGTPAASASGSSFDVFSWNLWGFRSGIGDNPGTAARVQDGMRRLAVTSALPQVIALQEVCEDQFASINFELRYQEPLLGYRGFFAVTDIDDSRQAAGCRQFGNAVFVRLDPDDASPAVELHVYTYTAPTQPVGDESKNVACLLYHRGDDGTGAGPVDRRLAACSTHMTADPSMTRWKTRMQVGEAYDYFSTQFPTCGPDVCGPIQRVIAGDFNLEPLEQGGRELAPFYDDFVEADDHRALKAPTHRGGTAIDYIFAGSGPQELTGRSADEEVDQRTTPSGAPYSDHFTYRGFLQAAT